MELSAASLALHPAIEPDHFLKSAQACMAEFHQPPTTQLRITEHDGTERSITLSWEVPPDRVRTSKQRPDLVEDGAIAIACLLLVELTAWRVTDIVQRGEGPDYWLGKEHLDHTLHLEVSGTDHRSLASIVKAKIEQLGKGRVGGYVAVSRFVEPRAYFAFHDYDAARHE